MKARHRLLLPIIFFFLGHAPLCGHSPQPIMGSDSVGERRMLSYLILRNPQVDKNYARRLTKTYIAECAREGVRPLVAFAQMCLETNFLHFSGTVSLRQNNFCGMGSTHNQSSGNAFPNMRTGVRAHVQHLKAYASAKPLHRACADPRRRWVELGCCTTVESLDGHWATAPQYGQNILRIMRNIENHKL
jgi:hypothetical protein